MKRKNYIWILILICLVSSARTCTEDEESIAGNEKRDIINLKNNVKQVFMSDSLSDTLLRAFEITASEKLIDFADYIKIISDTSLDARFRQQTAELVRSLFISDEISLTGWSKFYTESGLYTLERLLKYILSEGMSVLISPAYINIHDPFVLKDDSTYIGNLTCRLEYSLLGSRDPSIMLPDIITVDIYLIKRPGNFGNDHFKIWEAYLGDINLKN